MRATYLQESERLHQRARAFAMAFDGGLPPPEAFGDLARDLACFQYQHNPLYQRLCHAKGIDGPALAKGAMAPAVPSDVFKWARVSTFPEDEQRVLFRTSGTTLGQRGSHGFRDLASYDMGAVAFGRWALFRGQESLQAVLVLGPSEREVPDSSLTHMNALFARTFGPPAREDETYFMSDGTLRVDALQRRLETLMSTATGPVTMLGTSFAYVHLLDALAHRKLPLPPGSRVMQTGGFKGKSREVEASALRHDLATLFAIPERAVVSEYGMTELSSQFYERTAVDAEAPLGSFSEPPWARIVPVDPGTLEPVPPGEVGIARIEDLMNIESAFAIVVPDRVRRVGTGFELLGRTSDAPPRGCSIGIDEMLGR
jgi:hypothetical protein